MRGRAGLDHFASVALAQLTPNFDRSTATINDPAVRYAARASGSNNASCSRSCISGGVTSDVACSTSGPTPPGSFKYGSKGNNQKSASSWYSPKCREIQIQMAQHFGTDIIRSGLSHLSEELDPAGRLRVGGVAFHYSREHGVSLNPFLTISSIRRAFFGTCKAPPTHTGG